MPDGNNARKLFNDKLALILRSELSVLNRAGLELYIYLGEPSKIALIRKQLREKSLLLFFHPLTAERIDLDEWTLPCPFESDFAEIIWLAVSCFKPEKINCAMSETASFRNENLAKIKKTADEALLNIENERLQRLPRLRASIQNFPKIFSQELLTFKKVPCGTPAIVCGAGPSLTSQMPLIKKLSKKALIIASGRFGGTFLKNGIIPDFVVHLDAELEGDPSLPEMPDSTLIALPGTSPIAVSKFNKIIWTRGDSVFFNRFLRENEIILHDLRTSMTSTVTALDLALKMGCANIMLAGCDLCLSKKGDSHVGGEKSSAYQEEFIEVAGNAGEKVATLKEFDILRSAIENLLESIKKEGANFYNCALEGAAIRNAPVMPLEEFASKFVHDEIDKEFAEKCGVSLPCPDLEQIKKLLKEYADFSNEKLKCLEEIKRQKDNAPMVSGLNKGLALLEKKLLDLSDSKIKNFAMAIDESIKEIFPDAQKSGVERAKMERGLCLDIINDFEWDGNLENKPCTREFEAFKNQAVDFIGQNNLEFANALKNNIFDKEESECVLFLKGIGFPSAVVCGCKLSDYEGSARSEVEAFSNQTAFDSVANACVIVDPGNWHCAVEFAKKYPEACLVIVDPRPGLFSKIIKRCEFAHFFNEKTLVIGVHDTKLPNWKKLYSEKLAALKAERKNIAFFRPSSTWKFAETKKLFENLQDL